MRITFQESNPEVVLGQLKEKLGGRKLGDLVDFELDEDSLTVTIKKMGKSFLKFENVSSAGGINWELTQEKIALTHKVFKDEMIEKLTSIIQQIGGKVH